MLRFPAGRMTLDKDAAQQLVEEASLDAGSTTERERMAAAGKRILIVEDDVALGKFLTRALTLKEFTVEVCLDGESAWATLEAQDYDLVILDLNLPGMDGMTLMKQARQTYPRLRLLVLTARNSTEDLVSALEQGADDCLLKPFSFLELLARVRGLLRREMTPTLRPSRVGDLIVNREEHWVQRGERRIDLTPREFEILVYMLDNAGKPISRKTLMQEVWRIPFDPSTNIVDVYMKYLRDKINVEGDVKLIRTVRGVGYVLRHD